MAKLYSLVENIATVENDVSEYEAITPIEINVITEKKMILSGI
jgi:hypothetical protein